MTKKVQIVFIFAIIGTMVVCVGASVLCSFINVWGMSIEYLYLAPHMKFPFLSSTVLRIVGSLLTGIFFLFYWYSLKNFRLFRCLALVSFILIILGVLLFVLFPLNTLICEGMPCFWLSWALFSFGLFASKPASKSLREISVITSIFCLVITLIYFVKSAYNFLFMQHIRVEGLDIVYNFFSWIIGSTIIVIFLGTMYLAQKKNLKGAKE